MARMWRERGLCLAALLMLDPVSRRWSPLIPTQTSNHRTMRISVRDGDFASIPAGWVIAGSYQGSPARSLVDAWRTVLAFDGLHCITCRAGERHARRTFAFLRNGGGDAALADPAAALVDDITAALRDAADRIQVG
jgi:hypothetical protein